MIQVKLPDGSIGQFPDGTPDDVVVKAIQQQFPPQQQVAAASQTSPIAPPQQTYAQGIPSQALSGVNEGIAGTLGFPVDAVNSVLRAGAAGLHAVGGPDIQLPENAIGGSQTFRGLMAPSITPPTQDAGGQMARRIGEDVGAALVPTMGAAAASSRPLATAAVNLGTSLLGGAGAATANQVAPNNQYADLAGELIGDAVGGGIPRLARRAVTPFPIDADRAAMNATMASNGVDLTAGQQTGSNALKYAESELGGGKAQSMTEQQRQQFTQAALNRAGISAEKATPDVVDKAFTDVGQRFDDLGARNYIVPDKQFGADLSQAVNGYKSVVGPTAHAPIIDNTIQDLIGYVRSGTITGDQYKTLRSSLGRAQRNTSSPELAGALKGINDALDGAMERTIARTNPSDLGEWQQVRQDYKNLLVIADATKGAGETSAMGLITPAKLRQAAVAQNARGYVRGRGDFADLARAGEATMTPLPQSGTAPRMAARALTTGPTTIAGALLGGHLGGDIGTIAGMTAGTMVPKLAGAAIMSDWGQKYLANQLLSGKAKGLNGAAGPLAAALIHQAGSQ